MPQPIASSSQRRCSPPCLHSFVHSMRQSLSSESRSGAHDSSHDAGPPRCAMCARAQSPACAACAADARLQLNGCLHGLLHAAMHRCTGVLPLLRLQDGGREATQAALGLCNGCGLDVNLLLCHRVRGNSAGLLKNVGDGWVLLHGARVQQNGAASSTLQNGTMHASSGLGLTLRVLRSCWRHFAHQHATEQNSREHTTSHAKTSGARHVCCAQKGS